MNAKKRITNYITNSIFYVFSLHSGDLCKFVQQQNEIFKPYEHASEMRVFYCLLIS